MNSRFTRLFKKSDEDELRAFQKRVLAVLRELHPDKDFLTSNDPLAIKLGEQTLGLTNVHSNFLLSGQSDDDLREIVAEHFRNVFIGLEHIDREELSWERAKQLLMPQLMPAGFLQGIPLISFPFGESVVLGFVIDSEKAYSYVSQKDAESWGVNESEIREAALDNLSERSSGIEAAAFPGQNGLVVVNTLDGFDAVRIVVPELRNYIGGVIGFPFFFAVPNRDFLICWTKNDDAEFQGQMRSQISRDFDERPYPLSRAAFEAAEDGELKQAENTAADPRAAAAENN